MSKMKTVREWLNELPDGYRERAIANCQNPNAETGSLREALFGAFAWWDSKEGYEFWDKVCNHNNATSSLPPLPTEGDIPEPVEANPLCNISSEKTLLDEFAMVAMAALIQRDIPTPFNQSEKSFVVEWAFEYAKAMMEARKGLGEG